MALPADLDARRYYRVAIQRLKEGELILTKVGLPAAATYLGGYAVECILKALIVSLTPAAQHMDVVRAVKEDYGHNLRRLRVALLQSGVHLPNDIARELVLVSSWSPEMRYDPGPGDTAKAGRFLASVGVIVTWADGRL